MVGHAIDGDRRADGAAIAAEAPHEEGVGDDAHCRRAKLLVVWRESAPDERARIHELEEAGRDVRGNLSVGIVAADATANGNGNAIAAHEGEPVDRVADVRALCAPIGERRVGRGAGVGVVALFVDGLQPPRGGVRESADEHGVDDAEDRGGAADGEGERDYRRHTERGGTSERAEGIAEVADHGALG